MKNYGVNLEKEKAEQSEKDWLFGSNSPICASRIPEEIIHLYLPKGEIQRGAEDTMDCGSRSPNNKIETLLQYLFDNGKLGVLAEWLIDNGYVTDEGKIELSDAYIAILSGTTDQGNSLKAPIEALRLHGFIPKSKLPLEPWMTRKEYLDPKRVTEEHKKLGQESRKRFPIGYDKVLDLNESDACTAGYAWPEPVDGEYPRVEYPLNHAFWKFKNPQHYIFDNYVDSVDGDFIKKLNANYKLFDYGYRVFFTAINEIPEEKLPGFWYNFTMFLKSIFKR